MRPVIFDFNGTMFRDTDKNKRAWSAMVEKYAGRRMLEEEFRDVVNGGAEGEILRYFFGPMDKERERRLGDEKEEMYRDFCRKDAANLHLAPGLEEFLDFLLVKNVPRAIATGSRWDNMDFYFEEFGLARWFDRSVVVVSDGSFKGKPAPDIYILAAKRMGRDIRDCLVIEDGLMGVKSALAAGAGKIVGIHTGSENDYILSTPGIDLTVEDFYGFMDWYG